MSSTNYYAEYDDDDDYYDDEDEYDEDEDESDEDEVVTMSDITTMIYKDIVSNFDEDDLDSLSDLVPEIRSAYSAAGQQAMAAADVNYSLDTYQAAYTFNYGPFHVDTVRKVWKYFYYIPRCRQRMQFGDELNICCVGGGPALDAIGIHLFYEADVWGGPSFINLSVMERHTAWKATATSLADAINDASQYCTLTNIKYHFYDFFEDHPTPNSFPCLWNADLVTLVKFVSVVCQDEGLCRNNLMYITNCMRHGALLLFIDNSGGPFNEVFQIAAYYGLQLLAARQHYKVYVNKGTAEVMSEYCLAGENRPKKTGRVTASLWYKP